MRKAGSGRMGIEITVFSCIFIALGLICFVWGGILTILEHHQKRKERMAYDHLEHLIKSSNAHWLYCASCERWWFTHRKMCARCADTLEEPDRVIFLEFLAELSDFWNALTLAGMERPYPERPQHIFSENEVAGLMWTKQRAEKARK